MNKENSSAGMMPDGSKVEIDVPKIGRPGCANCAFVILVVDGNANEARAFECRRYAPRPGQIAAWPVVNPADWCGMYCSRQEFAEGERARREAAGAMRLLRDVFDPEKTPPENLNG